MAYVHAVAHLTSAGLDAPEGELRTPGRMADIPRPGELRSNRRLRFARLDRLARLCLTTAAAAFRKGPGGDEGVAEAEPEQVGAAIGTCFGAHLSNERFQAGLMAEGQGGASPALFPYTLPSAAAGELSIHLSLQGPLLTLCQGPGSGLSALQAAADQLRLGHARWMLAGAADTVGDTLLRAAGPDAAGTLEEGAVFLLLSSQAEGAVGHIAGWGSALGAGAMERAARAAGPPDPAAEVLRLEGGVQPAHLPLLALARHLERGADRPLMLCLDHGDGGASALYLIMRSP